MTPWMTAPRALHDLLGASAEASAEHNITQILIDEGWSFTY
jgi:hypothetical protein